MHPETQNPALHPIAVGATPVARSAREDALYFARYMLRAGALMVGFMIFALVLVAMSAGCSTTARQEQAVIDEGYHLVESWEPDGPNRATAKASFLSDAKPFVTPSPSPTPSPAGAVK